MDKVQTRVRAGGLRYESKASQPNTFQGGGASSISCFRCGRHMPRSRLESFRFAGALQFRCRGGCCAAKGD